MRQQKEWIQSELPLKIIKDLGTIYATANSTKKARYIVFECPACSSHFRAEPSKVKSMVITKCRQCATPAFNTLHSDSGLKQCSSCKEILELKSFYKSTRKKDGYDSRCKHCADTYKDSWVNANIKEVKEKRGNAYLQARYGISVEEYNKMLQLQNHQCAVCGNEAQESSTRKFLSVDHDHSTGKVRGLLCQKCNTGIGLLGDNTKGLNNALQYLNKHEYTSQSRF